MKATIKQNNKAVHINHITLWPFSQNIMVCIDTDEKWPEMLGSGVTTNHKDEITVTFCTPESEYKGKNGKGIFEPKKHLTEVTLNATTKAERDLFKNGFFLEQSQRYGRAYILTPGWDVDHEPKCTTIFEKRRRRGRKYR